jgi:hypothetical protein
MMKSRHSEFFHLTLDAAVGFREDFQYLLACSGRQSSETKTG